MSISRQIQVNTPTNLAHIWTREIEESLAYFNQVEFNCPQSLSACYPYYQRTREQVETAMLSAYSYLTSQLGYYPAVVNGYQDFASSGSRGRRWRTHLKSGKVHALGKTTISLEQADVAVVYSKSDASLAYNDVATITYVSTLDASDIIVRFKSSDCPLDFPADDDSRLDIKPLVKSSNGATITITGSSSVFAKPSLQFDESASILDPTVATNFVSQVNLYSRAVDYDTPAELYTLAESRKSPSQATALDVLSYTQLEDDNSGLISLPAFSSAQDKIIARVHFVSGYVSPIYDFEPPLARALAIYGSTLMPEFTVDVNEVAYRNWANYRQFVDAMDLSTGRQKVTLGELETIRILSAYKVRNFGAS